MKNSKAWAVLDNLLIWPYKVLLACLTVWSWMTSLTQPIWPISVHSGQYAGLGLFDLVGPFCLVGPFDLFGPFGQNGLAQLL